MRSGYCFRRRRSGQRRGGRSVLSWSHCRLFSRHFVFASLPELPGRCFCFCLVQLLLLATRPGRTKACWIMSA